ncbi:MAG: cytidylate kinase family protein [Bryobacteraceae bacterium]
MAFIAISGQPGCRFEEMARICAGRLGFDLINQARLASLIAQQFGSLDPIPDKAYRDIVVSILAPIATRNRVVFCADSAEALAEGFPGALRVGVVASEAVRVGNLMVDGRLERPAARELLRSLDTERKQTRKRRFGAARERTDSFDLILNEDRLDPEHLAEIVGSAFRDACAAPLLSQASEAQLQFQVRLRLARHGIVPPENVVLARKAFAHPSEQTFVNLLNFYRIAWEYEPRSFAVRWDGDGKVVEAFTPDFYLPEFDLYVELTTMKQSLVTRKNRKVKLLRQIYPDINIQVFYQKDFENLIFKYGLAEHRVSA